MLGVVQGVTEFFPVSSSGHIFLLSHSFNLPESLPFTIILHGGSLLAVCIYFWHDLLGILRGFWRAAMERSLNPEATFGLKLGLATVLTIPSALVTERVLPFGDMTLPLVAWTLIVTGILVLTAEYAPKREREFSWTFAVILGLVQGLAVVPGLSRSGLTVAFLVFIGLSRSLAARASFLLAIPTIVGAIVFAVHDMLGGQTPAVFSFAPLLVAFGGSLVASVLSIKYMFRLIEGRWVWVAPYCFALALLLFFL